MNTYPSFATFTAIISIAVLSPWLGFTPEQMDSLFEAAMTVAV